MIKYQIKKIILDGKEIWKLKCPKCNNWGYLDEEQLSGLISILCDCGFHKTINLKEKIKK